MSDFVSDILRRHCRPLEPVAPGAEPVLGPLEGIRAVLFDLYGTLIISGSGEVGPAGRQAAGPAPSPEQALEEAFRAMGIRASGPLGQGVQGFCEAIEASHAESRRAGIDYPEVDIVEIWREVLAGLARRGLIEQADAGGADLRRLAVEYEARVNPCWPMPQLAECLGRLCQRQLPLGIISNAQFYSPKLLEVLLGGPAERWGFEPDLQYYSYRQGRAKPGRAMFEMAAEALGRREIATGEALYVGNDMLNDVFPARQIGFRTALFAGDGRSFRRRDGEPQLEGIRPDLVLTELLQLIGCIIM